MKQIVKYEVGRNGDVYTITGRIARLLNVEWIPTQGAMVFCEISDNVEEVSLDIASIGTGWELPDDVMQTMRYFGSIFDGMDVWHYYWTRHIEASSEASQPDNSPAQEGPREAEDYPEERSSEEVEMVNS